MKDHELSQRAHYAKQYQDQRPVFELDDDADLWDWAKWYPLLKLEPFFATLNGRSVVTICSGAGREIGALAKHGARITATDLTIGQLIPLNEEGIVVGCCEQNAERLDFQDESFDVGFVNAGLHHLLHPHAGLCELLRVAKHAAMFIESQDSILHSVGKLIGRNADFEPAGNYVYRWSIREVEKIALSAHAHTFAVRTDFLPVLVRMRGIKGEKRRRWQRALEVVNKFMSPWGNLMMVVIFKTPPDEGELRALTSAGFATRDISSIYPDYVPLPWKP